MRTVLKQILVMGGILGLALLFLHLAFQYSMNAAEDDCAKHGAKPKYTYQTRYVCVTPDGRIVQ